MSARLAIAAPSALSADAAAAVGAAGGSPVDCAITAATVAMLSEPGIVAPGAGAFVTVVEPQDTPIVYDGYVAVPGRQSDGRPPVMIEAPMEYGGGITTLVGPGSVAVPGAWAAFGDAHARHGRVAWADVLAPAIRLASEGVRLGATSVTYLAHSHKVIFGHDPASDRALHAEGPIPVEGARVWLPGLEESLRMLAKDGAEVLYRGRLGARIGRDLTERGSLLGVADLAAYRTIERRPLAVDLTGMRVYTNPAPAVGGVALAALLIRTRRNRDEATMIEAQREVFGWRRQEGDLSSDRQDAIDGFLSTLPPDAIRSGSTAHVSVVESTGAGCAITLSAGYGSGVIPTGTGMWMNNALGEIELVGDRSHLRVGDRLNSNMAPTIARGEDGVVVVIGSPGADRITTALAQTLNRLVDDPADPQGAVSSPRLHVDVGPDSGARLAVEPGIRIPDGIDLPVVSFDDLHMYFGGVGLAMRHGDGSVRAICDPRRNGVARLVE